MPCARNTRTSVSSVSAVPRDRMRAITSLRLALVKTSGRDFFLLCLLRFEQKAAEVLGECSRQQRGNSIADLSLLFRVLSGKNKGVVETLKARRLAHRDTAMVTVVKESP